MKLVDGLPQCAVRGQTSTSELRMLWLPLTRYSSGVRNSTLFLSASTPAHSMDRQPS